MKLSEAVMLGSANQRLEPRIWMCKDGGCLVGLGGYAVGVRWIDSHREIGQIVKIWPWLDEQRQIPQWLSNLPRYVAADYPAFCWVGRTSVFPDYALAKEIISVLAVHVKLGTITLEKAIEWIRESEPQEPEIAQPEVKEAEEKIYVAQ